ncbi:hypothetical protein EVAR_77699_1 [Eumeta japonica]|uniref:Uncharacterized protein n=1 Tax=Eumeta variegata TaxID=151549 RepID=A0A4C1TAM3_EUMVA|nr:hypothetical protein EVAR_77699_1 [Eumeta japonica]
MLALSLLNNVLESESVHSEQPTTSHGPFDIFGHMGRIAEAPLNTEKSSPAASSCFLQHSLDMFRPAAQSVPSTRIFLKPAEVRLRANENWAYIIHFNFPKHFAPNFIV